MKVLVTGAKGQLGYDCVRELKERGVHDVLGVDKTEMNITNEKATKQFVRLFKPDVIIHCASWTAVDKAENNIDLVNEVNVLGTRYLSEIASEIGAKIVYISTDYVFSGKKQGYYETDDNPEPLNVYGLSKLNGEIEIKKCIKHFVVRTSWVYGINGNNFVKTMLKLGESNKEVSVVSDQVGSPTYTRDLAKFICDIIETDKFGVYHATNEGVCSWYEFAEAIFNESGLDVDVIPLSSAEYLKTKPLQARRPLNSKLSKTSLDDAGFGRLPDWQNALKRFLKEIKTI